MGRSVTAGRDCLTADLYKRASSLKEHMQVFKTYAAPMEAIAEGDSEDDE